MRSLIRASRRSFFSLSLASAATFALGFASPLSAQTLETGPIKVTDSGSITPSGYALKGVTGTANNAGLFGYGTVASSAINIDGVVGYVQTQQSVGVVGWAQSTGTSAYGVYGYSATGPGVFGQSSGSIASIYAINTSAGGFGVVGMNSSGTGVEGTSSGATGVIGISTTGSPVGGFSGVAGADNSTAGANFGIAGTTQNSAGTAVYGIAINGGAGAAVSSDSGFGLIASSSSGVALEATGALLTSGLAYLGAPTGEGAISLGYSGTAADPALVATDAVGGTDLFGTYGFDAGAFPETFIVQSGTANASGNAPSGSSDTQVSGDLYIGGDIYLDCSAGGTFPASASGCTEDTGPAVKLASGAAVRTYRPRESIPTIEDFGEAQLTNGQVTVPLERTFAQTIDPRRSYLVFITSEGENRGLYVTAKTASGFVVREMNGGRSSSEFEYRIVAHPIDSAAPRLAAISRSQGHVAMRAGHFRNALAQKAASLHRLPQAVRIGRPPQRLSPPSVHVSN